MWYVLNSNDAVCIQYLYYFSVLTLALTPADGTESDCHAQCCTQSCSEHAAASVYTCPQGWENYGAQTDADWATTTAANAESYCCYKTCSSVPDGETCPDGYTMRSSSDNSACLRYDDGTSEDAVCTATDQDDCCVANCAAQCVCHRTLLSTQTM